VRKKVPGLLILDPFCRNPIAREEE
jgi:hypothetical protein